MGVCKFNLGGSKKYYLTEDYTDVLAFQPPKDINNEYGAFDADGGLWIWKGYEWDGPSGPAIDTIDFIDGSLVHDFLYQLMREGYLSRKYRAKADREMRLQTEKDNMPFIRRWWTWAAVRIGGYGAAGGRLKA